MLIREYLEENILLFDGSMGTYCQSVYPDSIGTPCELLNLTHPHRISEIHSDYIKSGAMAIKTNTFSANQLAMDSELCAKVIKEGFSLAQSYSEQAFVFADIGPIAVTDAHSLEEEYRFVIDCFLQAGAVNFLFETNNTLDGLIQAAEYIKGKKTDAFILCSFASQPDGFTRSAQSVRSLIERASACEAVDGVGLNCASGAAHMAKLVESIALPDKYFSAMPNAGYPTVLGNRTYYDGSPSYFAQQIGKMAAMGVRILGGCCGTTPQHIKQASLAIGQTAYTKQEKKEQGPAKQEVTDRFWEALCDTERMPIAVELDPPENSDISRFTEGAKILRDKGASVITIADCPIGRPRMDSSLLACKLHRELGVDVLPHMTCRDRNLNATKALLLGLCAEGVHNVLIVTGDPIPSADRDEVKSVYNFNSRMLAGYVKEISQSCLSVPFNVFGALNVNATNFDVQLRLAKEKEERGVIGFLTQPILTERALENLKRARRELKGKILGGIFPIVSYKNACFMNSEVAGIKVDERITELYRDKSREEAEELALRISVDIAEKIRPYADGYYLMTPFSRTELIGKIIQRLK